jgi:hypothetical protein
MDNFGGIIMNAQLIKGEHIPLGQSDELLESLEYSNSYDPFFEWDGGYICSDRENLNISYNYAMNQYEKGEYPKENGIPIEEILVDFTILYENLNNDLVRVLIE